MDRLLESMTAAGVVLTDEQFANLLARMDEDGLAVTAKRKTKAKPAVETWGDYKVECANKKLLWPPPVVEVEYADGEKVRASFASVAGKALNMGRAVRVASAFRECRLRSKNRVGMGARIADLLCRRADLKLDLERAQEAAEAARDVWLTAAKAVGEQEAVKVDGAAWREKVAALDAAKETARTAYEAAITVAGNATRAATEAVEVEIVAKIGKSPVVACRVEQDGKTVATFDPAVVNAKLAA